VAASHQQYTLAKQPQGTTQIDTSVQNAARKFNLLPTFSSLNGIFLTTIILRPTHTTVTENPSMTFVKGGFFRSSGHALEQPFKEQWWRRAEAWECPYVSDEKVIE
jgi:hypothetical protein